MNFEKSCGAVVFSNNKVLIIEHNFGHISFPKGHVEGDESEIDTKTVQVGNTVTVKDLDPIVVKVDNKEFKLDLTEKRVKKV